MIRLLVVDDSALMRRLLGELFTAEGDFTVAFARDGAEALRELKSFQPDVVTLDVHMPTMDGLACLDRIMVERPTPVVVASSVTKDGAQEALRALELGAVDVVSKPAGAVSLRMDTFGPPLVQKVRAAAAASLPKAARLRERLQARAAQPAATPAPRSPLARPRATGAGLVVVGCSTGGPPALDALLAPLPGDFPWPIVIAQHMPSAFTGALAQRLDGLTAISVLEVREPTRLEPGFAYVARGDADMIVRERQGALTALSAPADPAFRWRPSVDRLMRSAMEVLPPERLIGVLMTGMGDDGAASMAELSAAGGHAIAEAEETAVVWGMPGELVRRGGASEVAPLGEIAARLREAAPTS